MRALQLPDNEALVRAMSQGELEASVDAYDQAVTFAPASVEHELAERARQHQAHAAQAQAAREAGDSAAAESAGILSEMDAAELAKLRVADAARAEWAEAHSGEAAQARRAEAELRSRGLADRIPITDAEVAAAASQEREMPVIDPAAAAQWKAELAADNAAYRAAQAEKMARMTPVTDAEIAKYGTPRPEAQPEPEPEAVADEPARPDYEAARSDVADLSAKIDQLAEQEAERRAEMAQAEADEPVVREPQAEPELESSWQPGDAQGYQEPAATADAEPEMEIG